VEDCLELEVVLELWLRWLELELELELELVGAVLGAEIVLN
jgi:hypothetical protein